MFLTFYQVLSCLEFRLIFIFLSLSHLMNLCNLGFSRIKSLMCILIPSFLEMKSKEMRDSTKKQFVNMNVCFFLTSQRLAVG